MDTFNRVAFKEWAAVCELLRAGRQTVILRKGGIAEGRAGFEFKHGGFFLFPTHFHEQLDGLVGEFRGHKLELQDRTPDKERASIAFRCYAETVETWSLRDWAKVARLEDFHPWTETTIKERFDYKDAGEISLAVVRVYKMESPWEVPNGRAFGGCRSWVEMPEIPETVSSEAQWQTAMSDQAFEDEYTRLKGVLED